MPTEEELKNMSPEEIAKLQEQNCIFCRIASGEIPAKIIYKDDVCTAFLDINPASFGHMLLVPNKHFQMMPQLPEKEINHLGIVTKHLSQAGLKGLKYKDVRGTSIFIANGTIAGQRAPHFIIHIIPRKENDNIRNFDLKKNSMPKEQQDTIANALINKINPAFNLKIPTYGTLIEDEGKEAEVKTEEPEQAAHTEKAQQPEQAPQQEEKKDSSADLDKISKMFGV